jgi:hypothetical protein
VCYRFRTASGQSHEGEDQVSQNEYKRLQVGSVVPIQYDPTNPTISRLGSEPYVPWDAMLWWYGSALVFGILTPGPVLWAIRSRRLRQLARAGRVIAGQVVRCRRRIYETGMQRAYFVELHYAFTNPAGRLLHAWFTMEDTIARDEVPIAGQSLLVLYLNDRNYVPL